MFNNSALTEVQNSDSWNFENPNIKNATSSKIFFYKTSVKWKKLPSTIFQDANNPKNSRTNRFVLRPTTEPDSAFRFNMTGRDREQCEIFNLIFNLLYM